MLEVRDLHADTPHGRWGLHGADLRIRPGEIHGLLGATATSGKELLFDLIAGFGPARPKRGKILLEGEDILSLGVEGRRGRGVFAPYAVPPRRKALSMPAFLRYVSDRLCLARGLPRGEEWESGGILREVVALPARPEIPGGWVWCHLLQAAVAKPRLLLSRVPGDLGTDAFRDLAAGLRALQRGGCAVLLTCDAWNLVRQVVPDALHLFEDGVLLETRGPYLPPA